MKIELKNPSRNFVVGKDARITIKDMGNVDLAADEQLTFLSEDKEYDLCRKEWGYYATPSVNDRLKKFGFKTALVINAKGQIYVMIVDENKILQFTDYLKQEDNIVLEWLDERPLK